MATTKTPGVSDALAAYYAGWKGRYGVQADRGKADAGQMKRLVETHGVDLVVAGVGRYLASDEPYYADRQHPLGLFVVNAGRFIAQTVVAGRPDTDAATADAHAAARARAERADRVRAEAVDAVRSMPDAARTVLAGIAEAEVDEAGRSMPTWHPTPEARARLGAERMIEILLKHGRGRSMTEAAANFAPVAQQPGRAEIVA